MSYGLTSTGFTPKTFEVIREEINEEFRSAFGASINLSDDTVEGQLIAIFGDREALLWELAEAVYNSQNPDAVVDAAQDTLCALTGTVRRGALASTVTLMLCGTTGTVVTEGSQVSVDSTGDTFAVDEDSTLASAIAWSLGGLFGLRSIGTIRASNGAIWQALNTGTIGANAPDPAGLELGDTFDDGTVTWRYVGDGTGYVAAAATATETGPIVAVAGDITTIETPVSGWETVYNVLDADVGRDIETSGDLRVRREQELAASGTGPKDAIRNDLLDVEGVSAVRVFVNNSDVEDADGVPPHAVECLVQGGEDQDIFDALLQSVAAGIETHGTETGTAVDSEGNEQDVAFSRPEEIGIYTEVTLTYDPDTYAGDDAVKAAIVARGDAQQTGRDATTAAVIAAAMGVEGVLDVSAAPVGTTVSPSGSSVAISLRQLAVWDTSRVTINSSEGTP